MSIKTSLSLNALLKNESLLRQAWLRKLMDPRRDLDQECGYPLEITIQDYARAYERGDLAGRVVDVFPEESWSDVPDIYEIEDARETEFEKAWKELNKTVLVNSMMLRVDKLSGIGRFGVLLLGLDDGGELESPAPGLNEKGEPSGTGTPKAKLLYLRAFDETLVQINSLETDKRNPRFGTPTFYTLQFIDAASSLQGSISSTTSQSLKVHWSRVIHVADNRTTSEVYGTPRMKRVFDRLLDLKKVVGGSGEMFWKGGFPGLSIQTHPTLGLEGKLDTDATKAQVEAYMNGLQRYLGTEGMDVKSLSAQVADPDSHVGVQIKIIAAALGVPWRVLVGSEQSQLASEQDTKAWNKRVTRRRNEYVTPYIIRPTIDRLIAVGALPQVREEGVQVDWPDMHTPSDEEKASVAEKKTNAIAKYAQSGADQLIPPFHYLTLILDMPDEEAEAIIEQAEERNAEIADEEAEAMAEQLEQQAALAQRPRNGNGTQPQPPAPRPGNQRPQPVAR